MLEPKVDIFESHFRAYHELLISLLPFRSAIVEMVCEKRPKTIQTVSQVHSVVPLPKHHLTENR